MPEKETERRTRKSYRLTAKTLDQIDSYVATVKAKTGATIGEREAVEVLIDRGSRVKQ